jgi:hypothetical protein
MAFGCKEEGITEDWRKLLLAVLTGRSSPDSIAEIHQGG